MSLAAWSLNQTTQSIGIEGHFGLVWFALRQSKELVCGLWMSHMSMFFPFFCPSRVLLNSKHPGFLNHSFLWVCSLGNWLKWSYKPGLQTSQTSSHVGTAVSRCVCVGGGWGSQYHNDCSTADTLCLLNIPVGLGRSFGRIGEACSCFHRSPWRQEEPCLERKGVLPVISACVLMVVRLFWAHLRSK